MNSKFEIKCGKDVQNCIYARRGIAVLNEGNRFLPHVRFLPKHSLTPATGFTRAADGIANLFWCACQVIHTNIVRYSS